MLFHEFEKSPAAAEQEQFSNFMDRGFALAVKNAKNFLLAPHSYVNTLRVVLKFLTFSIDMSWKMRRVATMRAMSPIRIRASDGPNGQIWSTLM